jgi:hypothetical protein
MQNSHYQGVAGSFVNGVAQQQTSTAVAGRKTFYISDYQKAKQ